MLVFSQLKLDLSNISLPLEQVTSMRFICLEGFVEVIHSREDEVEEEQGEFC